MKNFLGIILLIVVAGIAGVFVNAAMKPDTFKVERSMLIEAPAGRIYPLIEDFHKWTVWSPYETQDPQMNRTYGGAKKGMGAKYSWTGKISGAGSMEITEAKAPGHIKIKLDLIAPMPANNTSEFVLVPDGKNTKVTWTMYGPNPYMARLMQAFISVDRLVGDDFVRGLQKLEDVVEATPEVQQDTKKPKK